MKLLGYRDQRMTLRYTKIADETVGQEYFEALMRISERCELARPGDPLEPVELEPVAQVQDAIRWVSKNLCRGDLDRRARLLVRLLLLGAATVAHAKSTDKQLCNDLAQFEDTVTRLGNLGPQNSVKDMQTLTQKAKTTGQRGPRRDQHPLIGPGDARAVSGRGSRQAVGCVRGRSGDDARAAWAPWYRFISKPLAKSRSSPSRRAPAHPAARGRTR